MMHGPAQVRAPYPGRWSVAKSRLIGLSKQGFNALRLIARVTNGKYRQEMTQRAAVEQLFHRMAEKSTERFAGRVLVDAMFDNPNFWYRLTLVRAAMGLAYGHEIGLTGQFNVRRCSTTFKRLGIGDVVSIFDYFPAASQVRAEAHKLLQQTHTPEDILEWRLPFNFPAEQAYDAILKWQRQACVELVDPRLEDCLTRSLQYLYAADRLLTDQKVDLVLISQPINFDEGGLSWLAAQRGIRTITVTGHSGLTRLRQGFTTERVFAGGDRPTLADIKQLPEESVERLAAAGSEYLERRINGQTNELGAIYAYRRRTAPVDRQSLIRRLNWNAAKPIVIVYAANWFDYPHTFGMKNFRDFLHWMQVTLDMAQEVKDVNWLLKAHPCDEWYGGVTLADLTPKQLPPHIAFAPTDLNSKDLLLSVDAMITVHGTSALEFVHLGKPVLLADRGWYDEIGFCARAESLEIYKDLLKRRWWDNVDREQAMRLARIFTGMVFCCPQWQNGLVCGDDPEKGDLYIKLADMVSRNANALDREIQSINDWLKSDTEGFHTYKMMRAKDFIVGAETAGVVTELPTENAVAMA